MVSGSSATRQEVPDNFKLSVASMAGTRDRGHLVACYHRGIVTIGPESSLRKIPSALDRKQTFLIEGIRVSLEMIVLAYE